MNIHAIKPAIFLMIAVSLTGFGVSVNAAAFIDLGNTAGSQCETIGVNDNGLAVGNCSEPNFVPNNEPWVANIATSGPQQSLASMVTGQPCWVAGVSNAGTLAGGCVDASNTPFAVVWNATSPSTAPLKLNPLPFSVLFPPLHPADKSTAVAAFTQQGGILGSSIDADNDATVVFYSAGSATPIQVSNRGDNCVGVDVINGGASVAMNCPNATGTKSGVIAQRSGSSYSATTLPVPSGATNCTASSINNQSQIIGTCQYPNSTVNVRKTAYWATPTSTPLVLTLSAGSKNRGISINNSGFALAVTQGVDGRLQHLIWAPLPTPIPAVNFIPLPAGSVWVAGAALADSNTVVFNSTNSSQHPAACTWNNTNGTQCLAPINGGLISRFTSISQSGAFAGGINLDSAQDAEAVATPLP